MNRHQRRAAGKPPQQPIVPTPVAGSAQPVSSGKPGVVLRFFARILLSKWVLKRVNHPEVRQALASLAAQAGRPELSETLRRQA